MVARADHRRLRRRGDRLPGEDQVLRLPDHPGARGDGARRADPADRAGDGGRRRRDRHAVPALPPLARRLAVEAEGRDRQGLRDADPPPLAARRRRRRARGVGAEVQAPRRLGRRRCSRSSQSEPGSSRPSLRGAGARRGGAAAGGWFEAGWVRLRELDVRAAGLPPELDGLRIAHLSDFHLGVPSRGARAVERAVDWVVERAARPRLRHRRPARRARGRARGCASCSSGCRTPYVVLGNHDFADSPRPVLAAGRRRRPRARHAALRRRRSRLELRGRRVQLVGVDPRATWLDAARRASSPTATPTCGSCSATSRESSTRVPRAVRPGPRGPPARRPDLRPVRFGQAAASRIPSVAVRRRGLPARRRRHARLARARDDVRPVPVLRAPGGDGARSTIGG